MNNLMSCSSKIILVCLYILVQLPTVEYDVDTESTVVYEDKKKPLSLGIMPAAHTFSVFDEYALHANIFLVNLAQILWH